MKIMKTHFTEGALRAHRKAGQSLGSGRVVQDGTSTTRQDVLYRFTKPDAHTHTSTHLCTICRTSRVFSTLNLSSLDRICSEKILCECVKAFLCSLGILLNVISSNFNIIQLNTEHFNGTFYFEIVYCISSSCRKEPTWSRLFVGPLGPMLLGAMAALGCGSALVLGTLGAQAASLSFCSFFCHILLYSFVILYDLENYFFLLVTLRELIAVALHARQVWCYFTLNLRTVKLQRRSWNRLRTSSGLSSGVLAAQPVWFEGRRGCKTGSTGQRSQRMLWSTTLQIGCDSGIFDKHWEATNTSIQFQPTAAQGIYQIGFLASGSWPSPCVDIVDSLWRVQEKIR